jgi:thiol-disulfide isomerase/thioredoxin
VSPVRAAVKPTAQERDTAKVQVDTVAAPDFTLENVRGGSTSLGQLRGKVVLVNFWASWCPPCREELPSMERLVKSFPKDQLTLLAINLDKQSAASFKNSSPSFEILLDPAGQVQRRYGVVQLPTTFVIDGQGIVRERIVGAIAWDDPKVIDYLQTLANEVKQ